MQLKKTKTNQIEKPWDIHIARICSFTKYQLKYKLKFPWETNRAFYSWQHLKPVLIEVTYWTHNSKTSISQVSAEAHKRKKTITLSWSLLNNYFLFRLHLLWELMQEQTSPQMGWKSEIKRRFFFNFAARCVIPTTTETTAIKKKAEKFGILSSNAPILRITVPS